MSHFNLRRPSFFSTKRGTLRFDLIKTEREYKRDYNFEIKKYPAFVYRVAIYGLLVILIVCVLIWKNQQTNKIFEESSEYVTQKNHDFNEAISTSLKSSRLSTIELLDRGNELTKSRLDLGIVMLEEARRREPTLRDVLLSLGIANLRGSEVDSSKLADAKAVLKQARTVDPIYPLTYELLSEVYTKLGDMKAAEEARTKAETFAPVAKLTEMIKK